MYAKITWLVTIVFSTQTLAITTLDLTQGITPTALVAELIDTSASNITYSNISYRGVNSAAGIFQGGDADGLGISRGILLTSGRASNAIGPNKCYKTTAVNQQPGDAQLSAGNYDAAVLEFDFVPTADQIEFQYVFASEEYNEFVGTPYNDVFAFFLDGKNIALVPATSTEVAINTVNLKTNAQYYRNNAYPWPTNWNEYFNSGCRPGSPTPFLTEFDGFTTVLKATANVALGQTHRLKLVVADRGDYSLDSAVFIQGKSFRAPPPPPPVIPPPLPAPAKVNLVSLDSNLTTRLPNYSWNALANATKYHLKVDDATGTVIDQWLTAAQANCGSGTGTCAVNPTNELLNGAYQWWVQAANDSGPGPWSEVGLFTVAIQPPPPPVTICTLYAVDDQDLNDSQLLMIDQTIQTVTPLGDKHSGFDIEALDAHPLTKVLYAAASHDAKEQSGTLYQINSTDGKFTRLGNLSLATGGKIDDITGLSFNPDTNQLWGWAPGKGLFKLTEVSNLSAAEIKWPSTDDVEDLTWNNQGDTLYLANQNKVVRYDGTESTPVCTLPKSKLIESLEMTTNDTLLIGLHDDNVLYTLDLTVVDPEKGCHPTPVTLPVTADLEGMAWVCTTQPATQ